MLLQLNDREVKNPEDFAVRYKGLVILSYLADR